MIGLLVYDASFYKRIAEFSKRYPRYQQKDGTTNTYHIIRAVEACGYDEVNCENIDAVMSALEARALAKAQA